MIIEELGTLDKSIWEAIQQKVAAKSAGSAAGTASVFQKIGQRAIADKNSSTRIKELQRLALKRLDLRLLRIERKLGLSPLPKLPR